MSLAAVRSVTEDVRRERRKEPPKDVTPFELPLLLAQAYMTEKEWMKAMNTFQSLLQQMHLPSIGTPPQQRQVFMGMCQCLYKQGQYGRSIAAGTAAIEMNRHFPQVHKYVALAYRKLGDLENAMKTSRFTLHVL